MRDVPLHEGMVSGVPGQEEMARGVPGREERVRGAPEHWEGEDMLQGLEASWS